jgi:hypothetical protein
MDWGALVQAATAASQIAAQQAAAKSAAEANKAKLQQGNDSINQSGYSTDKQLDLSAINSAYQAALTRAGGVLNEQAANLAAPGKRASNAVRGDVLANLQDSEITGLPAGVPHISFTGGLRPSMFSGNTRALGAAMSRQALLDQMGTPSTPFSSLPALDVSSITSRTAPGATPLPTPSTLDNILSGLATSGAYAGAITPYLTRATAPKPSPTVPGRDFDPATGAFTE